MNRIAIALILLATACGGSRSADTTPPHVSPDDKADPDRGTPAQPVDLVFPEEPFRANQPAAAAPRPFQVPAVNRFQIGPKIDVYLIEDHRLPKISLQLSFEGGTINDPPGKEGLADTCMAMLTEGTRKLDKIAYREALADVASTISSYANRETQGIAMSTLTKQLEPTFALFVDTVTQPGFRKDELDRMIKRDLESLKQIKGSPSTVAERVRDGLLYGDRHPFGRIETERSLKAISIADCKRYHGSYVRPTGARLFVVGDMTADQVKAQLAPLLAVWKGKPRPSAKLAGAKPRTGRVFFVDIPNAPQSSVHLMHTGPARKDPAYFSHYVMAMVLGGGFASRINMNLRENKGYSYGARGAFSYSRKFGEFVVSTSVRADSTRQSVLEVLREVRQIQAGDMPATEAELLREKNGAILGMPARFETSSATLGTYADLVYFGLPLDYYARYIEAVAAVTPDQVAEAARSQLRPADLLILVVGDAKAPQIMRDGDKDVPLLGKDGKPVTLRSALEQLIGSPEVGAGKLVVLDPDGKVVR